MKDYLSSTEGNLDLFRVTGAYEQKTCLLRHGYTRCPPTKTPFRGGTKWPSSVLSWCWFFPIQIKTNIHYKQWSTVIVVEFANDINISHYFWVGFHHSINLWGSLIYTFFLDAVFFFRQQHPTCFAARCWIKALSRLRRVCLEEISATMPTTSAPCDGRRKATKDGKVGKTWTTSKIMALV